ncbi:ATP-dependent Lon protease PIM1 [Sugiyamaella lignohabitans]|uniref:Lon protease homolog n=1 Tax=Sugiyamaella lignohabitans TaxID=796027 RepID=A0A167CHR3_9ASCO|nr:ATP-dependent Lon protease PIM1 [Sugiyamaella lignohabitans]ANB11715.1 ATP-dependent Lon protease PIM1 [Sugiyamaella lignohabitans]
MRDPVQITIPILVLPSPTILFPSTALRITLPRDANDLATRAIGISKFNKLRKLVDIKSEKDVIIGVLPKEIGSEDIHHIGTLARVVLRPSESSDLYSSPATRDSILLQGLTRFKYVEDYEKDNSVDRSARQARVLVYDSGFLDKTNSQDKQLHDQMEELKQVVRKMIQPWGASGLSAMQRFLAFAQGVLAPGMLVDIFASVLPLSQADKLKLLDAIDVKYRLELAIESIEKHAESIIAAHKKNQEFIANSPSPNGNTLSKKQREALLRYQLKLIQDKLDELEKGPNGDNSNATPSSKNEVGFPIPPRKSAAPRLPAPADENDEDDEDGLIKLEQTLNSLNLPDEGRKIVNRELKRLKRMNANQAEYQVCRTYLETIAELPWNNFDNDQLDNSVIAKARQIFDVDHYGLEKVKKRLLEYLAVVYLKQQQQQKEKKELPKPATSVSTVTAASGGTSVPAESESKPSPVPAPAINQPITQTLHKEKAPILLLVGPPGVGKTSLAKSVAHALNRQLYRISLGGVRDEAEIRGHRRTYVGAMPGILAQALRKVQVMNPVIVLDEIDKLSQGNTGTSGDPSAAMLEVLDPEQNYSFVDRYINFPIDLSQVLFIATANTTDTIPRPLLDRMETIYIDGYTYLEKQHIAENYLIPKQLAYNGLEKGQYIVPPEVIDYIATRYTREAGVRNLERELGTLCRGKAVEQLENLNNKILSKAVTPTAITIEELPKYLGLEKFQDDVVNDEVDEYVVAGETKHRHSAGLVNGLAYMGSGNGGLLVFEATTMPAGSGNLKLTGKLGEVISESAQIALSWVRSNASRLGLPSDVLKNIDIHLHAPAGAIPKDGPSAGVAMTLTLVSLLRNKEVPRDIAMTGEITLRGKILPVGGIREKLLGAHLAGIRKVILPHHSAKTVRDECAFLKDIDMEIVYVKYIWDVFAYVWPDEKIVADSHL